MNLKTNFFGLMLLSALLLALLAGCDQKTDRPEQPNIILVLADDQGWGDMAYNGHPVLKTPNFDDMAGSGLRFDRFYAAAPVCSPTRGSIMTGRHPNRFGCFSWGHTLRPQEYTIAEALKDAGYITGHFGKWHLGPVYKDSPVNPGASGFDEWFSAFNFFENDPILSREGIAVQTQGESSMVTVEAALQFIKKHKDGTGPFFAYVCFGSPHQPHIADQQDKQHYSDLDEKLQNFYGEITGMDRAIGKLRQELKDMDLVDNTVLWYLSDNGGLRGVGSTGGREYKGSIYEGGLRVPAIIEWPGLTGSPRKTDLPCSTVDIYPTLLEIGGAAPDNLPVLDGISLVPLLNNKMTERDKPIGFWKYPEPGIRTPSHEWMLELLQQQQEGNMKVDKSKLDLDAGEISRQYPVDTLPGHAAWLDWPYKLHRIQQDSDDIRFELYDLDKDPMEEDDISESSSEITESMITQLEEWMRSVISSLNGNDYD